MEGTARKDRMTERASELDLPGTYQPPPEWLKDEGKAEWERLFADSRYAPALALVDRGMLATYCQLWARFVEGEKSDKPLGGRQLQTLVAVAAKLGLNPTDRCKVKLPAEKPADDPWQKLA